MSKVLFNEPQVLEQGNPLEDGRAFRRALGQFATGVTVITANYEGKNYGMTANSFSSVSIEPALILWSIRKESQSLAAFKSSRYFAINILGQNQSDVSSLFGRPSDNQFDAVSWKPNENAVPLIDGAIGHLECKLHETIDAGDHFIIIGEVEKYTRTEGSPLLFAQGQFGRVAGFPDSNDPGELAGANKPEYDHDPEAKPQIFFSLLRSAEQAASSLFRENRKNVGVNVATSRVLNHLSKKPENIYSLMQSTHLGETALEDALIELANQNLVSVSKSASEWEITESGRKVRNALRESAIEFTKQQLEGIAEEDIKAAERVLRTIISSERNSQ